MTLPIARKRQEILKFLEDSEAEEFRIELAIGGDAEVQMNERMSALTEALKQQQIKTAYYRKQLEALG